uniref:Retrovirus-related Pol polyprotein from transposon TNT 1-94-like beta-barrel domain-containing protein n=1 Tax=Cajanus cajan TaxID=3821 RepID=A0A151QS36_CAJCA|nr:hypothetical protein KK1_046057 [Cajanus cajan]
MNHTQENCYSLHGFPDKEANVSKSEKSSFKFSDKEYQDYLRLKSKKSNSQAQSSVPSVSTVCISQFVEGHGPWILYSGASNHISGNRSLFSFISSPKVPHLVTIANGSNVTSQGIGQVPLFPSKLNYVLLIHHCPYNLISLSQLTRSLNCSFTFDVNSFVIQECGTGCLIVEGHESRDLYYLKTSPPHIKETGLENCRPIDSSMDPNQKLMMDQGGIFPDPKRYKRLVRKLTYLTITRPDISFAIGVVNQFLQDPHIDHWNVVIHILKYIKRVQGQGLLYEAKRNTQVLGYCDADWVGCPIDRRSATGILFLGKARNKVLLPCHFIWQKWLSKELITEFISSNDQLADILTKSLRGPRIQFICSKLGAYNLYAPA